MKNAFFVLGYIKKLCQHPYLLVSASVEKKIQMGLIVLSEEQLEIERIQKEEDEQRVQASSGLIKTRRAMQEAMSKSRKQMKAIESVKDTPPKMVEGKLVGGINQE